MVVLPSAMLQESTEERGKSRAREICEILSKRANYARSQTLVSIAHAFLLEEANSPVMG